jgi:hypothetical protein
MAANSYFETKGLSIAQQRLRMQSLHPHFKLTGLSPCQAIWIGEVTPSSLSETYRVQMRYKIGEAPVILVLSPKLKPRDDGESISHIFPGKESSLCLYYGPYDEWHSGKFLADFIVPWISLWLIYYEAWHATGEWFGGGIEHVRN